MEDLERLMILVQKDRKKVGNLFKLFNCYGRNDYLLPGNLLLWRGFMPTLVFYAPYLN